MKRLLGLLLLCSALPLAADSVPQPRVCRPLDQNRPESFQQSLDRPRPTHLRLMGFRYVRLQQTVDGYASTGQRMVSRDDDGIYTPAECGDDPGLYMVAPVLVTRAGLTLGQAVDVTLSVLFIAPLAYAAAVLWSSSAHSKVFLACALLAVLAMGLVIGDLYLIGGSMAAAAVAAARAIDRHATSRLGVLHALMFGAIAGLANLFRGHSGTAALLFVLLSIAITAWPKPRRLVIAIALIAAFLCITFGARVVFAQRDAFLARQPHASAVAANGHPFWHTIWVSLGYVNNPYVPAVKDESGVAKVRAIAPTADYFGPEYEAVLRRETIQLLRHHPVIIAANLLAKAGTVLIVVLALLAPLFLRGDLRWTPRSLPWAAAIAFNALFGILAIPAPRYLTGLIAFCLLYVATEMGNAADDRFRVRGASA